jgi:Fe2+ or Zn2+ uptake regulation protein
MTKPVNHKQLYENALERLRASGYKVTNARREILEVLCQHTDHLTSAEVLEWIGKKDLRIGRASVFRALDLFTKLAIIRPTYIQAGKPSYIVMPDSGHHAHIICPLCEHVIELHDCEIEDSLEKFAEKYNIQITGHLLELYGKCKECE